MKTILVLSGGSKTDDVVFGTALGAARPLGAHLEFLHIRVSAGQAAAFTPHVDFAMGSALTEVLGQLRAESTVRSTEAARHFQRFCEQEKLEITDVPSRSQGVSATLHEESDDAVERMMYRARRNDLIVLGRSSHANGLPSDLIGQLLVGSGRPILIAPRQLRRSPTGVVMVCWKETPAAARALGTALPLLSRSKRVMIVGVHEATGGSFDGLGDLARQLAWHGISADFRWMPAAGRSAARQLESAAAQCDADLLVMGGYGHGRAREMVFGGCTQHFLDQAERPVLMMH
jgi:nucleotide-binding universal stress UspA family protein